MRTTQCLILMLVLTAASQAKAWTYTCPSQTISHKTVNYLTLTNSEGDFVTMRSSVNNASLSIPTLLADGNNEFVSHDRDVDVSINAEVDESNEISVHLKVKSLKINGTLTCQSVGI